MQLYLKTQGSRRTNAFDSLRPSNLSFDMSLPKQCSDIQGKP